MTSAEARDELTARNTAVSDLEKLDWNLTPAYVADTGDGGHYRVIELPGTVAPTLRFLAVRSKVSNGRLWEYMVGRFPSLDAALVSCWSDYKCS